jgi:hypothetical protein
MNKWHRTFLMISVNLGLELGPWMDEVNHIPGRSGHQERLNYCILLFGS